MIAREIIGLEKEENPPARLVADVRTLSVAFRPRQQKARPAPATHHDPTLTVPERLVLDKRQSEAAAVSGDRLVVVAHEQRERGNPSARAGVVQHYEAFRRRRTTFITRLRSTAPVRSARAK